MKRITLHNVQKNFHIHRNAREHGLSFFYTNLFGKSLVSKQLVLSIHELVFSSGEIVAITGKNGSGKTTLLRIISGIYQSSAGSIVTKGRIVSLIGLRLGLRDRLTVKENSILFSRLFGVATPPTKSILQFAELTKYTQRYTYELSQGMLQRLTLSIAFHAQPDIMLLDEVLEGSDKAFRTKAYKKIQSLAKAGTTILFTTHEADIISNIATRMIVLENGRIVSDKKII